MVCRNKAGKNLKIKVIITKNNKTKEILTILLGFLKL